MDYSVQAKDISFSFEVKKVLDKININIGKGSFFSIVGPNGSGKSTLLRVLSSILKPQNGAVYIDGRDIRELENRDMARQLSFVPQNTSFEFDFKVSDVVLMGRYPYIGRLRGETRQDRETARTAMKYTNTDHLADRHFMELSGGERQRVILAQALAQEPGILLLDEPVAHLDLQHQVELLNLIKKMCIDKNLTVVAVLHDLNMAATYSDYVIMMKNGVLRYQGTPYETLTEESIREIFNTEVRISVSPITRKPYIYALAKPHIEEKNVTVHVICGGGSGGEMIGRLYREGYKISGGVLSTGDLDWKVLKEFAAEVAEEIPFISISDDAYARNLNLLKKADYIVLTGLYFGRANIRNLEILLEPELADKRLLILEDGSFGERDFTGGKAQCVYDRLKTKSSVTMVAMDEVFSIMG